MRLDDNTYSDINDAFTNIRGCSLNMTSLGSSFSRFQEIACDRRYDDIVRGKAAVIVYYCLCVTPRVVVYSRQNILSRMLMIARNCGAVSDDTLAEQQQVKLMQNASYRSVPGTIANFTNLVR